MKIGILANISKTGIRETLHPFARWLLDKGMGVAMAGELKELACPGMEGVKTVPVEKLAESCDLVVAMGGDGTMLSAARHVGISRKPVLGVNLGRLGFLAEVSPQDLYRRMEDVFEGRYGIEERMLLEAGVKTNSGSHVFHALNDVVIEKTGISRLIQVQITVNGEFFADFRSDGIILSTPTGSTAYSLAAGGPVVVPTMDAMILCPICSHSLTARPTVLPGGSRVLFKLLSGRREVSISIDGQNTARMTAQTTLEVGRADHFFRLITFKNQSYFELLRQKLQWGLPPPGQ
ncbi:NAD(+)/NADH kinase [bacterium]|nr:NAD(+)/NADH kinase [bacterium]